MCGIHDVEYIFYNHSAHQFQYRAVPFLRFFALFLSVMSIPDPGIKERRDGIYPTMLEQPIVREFSVVSVHLDRKCADTADLPMQSFSLLLGERVTALFWVNSSVIQNFVWIVVK